MKQIVSNYSYSPATNVVTLTGVNIDADQLLLIVAPQVGRTLYNFASVTGTVSAGADTRVTLNASTAGLTTTSPLVIFYDDQASTQTVAGTVTATNNAIDNYLISAFEDAATSDASVAIRVQGTPGYPMPISGTVTANVGGIASGVTIPVRLFAEKEGEASSGQDTLVLCDAAGQLLVNAKSGGASVLGYDGNAFVSVKQVAGSSVTIGSLPAISGTVTANAFGYDIPNGTIAQIPVHNYDEGFAAGNKAIPVLIGNENGGFNSSQPLPISGTVTANAGTELGTTGNGYGFIALGVDDNGTATPLSIDGEGNLRAYVGTVTAAAPNGSLTTRFGTPTTANVSFATSAVTNANRKYLLIQNVTTGSNVITVGIGFTPTTTQGIQLAAGAGITFESSYIPTGAVRILSSVTASNFTILEA